MPYDTRDRATFVALLHHLAPAADKEPVLQFVRDHWVESLDELGADPGWDQVRAGLIRLAPDLLEPTERAERLQAARAVLDAYPEQAASGDPVLLMARHPAWVALSSLELDALEGRLHENERVRGRAIDRAVELATAGFAAASSHPIIGRGEVLWAIAEQADDAGWHDRAQLLLDAAVRGPFHDPTHAPRVRLLLGLRLVEDGDERGEEVLHEVARDESADAQARVHGLWVLAALSRRRGDTAEARELLLRGLSLVDDQEDAEVVQQLHGALDDLDDGDVRTDD